MPRYYRNWQTGKLWYKLWYGLRRYARSKGSHGCCVADSGSRDSVRSKGRVASSIPRPSSEPNGAGLRGVKSVVQISGPLRQTMAWYGREGENRAGEGRGWKQ